MDIIPVTLSIVELFYFLLTTSYVINGGKVVVHKNHHHKKPREYHQNRIEVVKTCPDCDIINHMQGDQAIDVLRMQPKKESICPKPCKPCSQPDPKKCKAGVSFLMDGCACCHICARQQGDICDERNICDPKKDLYCDLKLKSNGKGICRVNSARDCNHYGDVYKDGDFFKPNCSEYCTCQNGQVTCSTACPHEHRAPSSYHCKEAQLVSIKNRCCREWVCPHSFSLMGPDDIFPSANTEKPGKVCKKEITTWSACSKSCGVGISVRHTNDNEECQPKQESRLCLVRPCELKDQHLEHEPKKCRNTWRQTQPIRISHEGCTSKKDYRPKYCTICKSALCCFPDKTKTMDMQFTCPDGMIRTYKFSWIKSCDCKDFCPKY